ncbi:hypothetical protein KY348_03595 [Candidatus Woesearchaeota archaeon]|nr:hypothetical protein [Candidatus Woesearchaeota archaeon]
MHKQVLILSILITIFLALHSMIITGQTSLPPLSTDKNVYEVEETVEVSVNIEPEGYALYELVISAVNNSYTYKGDYNPVMFFYPTEEGIYTIALVEKSTRAIFYSVSFEVIPRERSGILRIEGEFTEEDMLTEPILTEPAIVVQPTEPIEATASISTDKTEYIQGEPVRVFLNLDGLSEENINLYHSFNGISQRYMGDLKYIVFIPEGIGLHELILEDKNDNLVYVYSFEVKPGFDEKIIKVLDSKGFEEDSDVKVYDEEQGFASLEITPRPKILKKINLMKVKVGSNLKMGVEEVAKEKINIKQRNVIKAFALDPSGLNFTNGTATGVAIGSELWKCKDWDFATQQCLGTWQKIMDLVPGKEYEIIITPDDPGYAETGIASINTKKPIYHPNETAEITIVVLDTAGHLVSGADVYLNITDQNNIVSSFSTSNNDIIETQPGIYKTNFSNTALEGNYSMVVRAIGSNVNSTMLSYFTVKSYYEFDIIRDVPVTTDPWLGVFDSSIRIISFTGALSFNFTEVLPANFTIGSHGGARRTEQNGKIYLTWTNLNNNSVVSYSARPPLVTPELYELGPSYINYSSRIFYEARSWYLAVDPTTYYDPDSNVTIGWDEGTGTDGFAEIDNGVRQPDTTGITADYVADYTQNADGISEFGFPAITQTPYNITLWVYTETESSCFYTFYLQQNGTTRCSRAIGTGTTANWYFCNWTNPTGDLSNLTIELSTVSKGSGAHSTCYVYEAYLEVDYNNPPNVTSLIYPPNGANLSSGTNIDFNFTVTDQETPIANCTLWGNFSGTWAANKTVYNVANNTETNITITVPDGSYIWNINCTDTFGDSDVYETNYSFRVDTIYPAINYSTGTEENDTYFNRNWIYVNVSVNETNEKNITFRLYNTSGEVNITTYTTPDYDINFTDLNSNMEYWYNVTVCDQFGWCNSTETRKITLDSVYPTINYSSGTEENDTYFSRTWIFVNVTANDTNEKNITFRLYNTSGPVNITTYTTPVREINFTNLYPDMQYWYNVTIRDLAGNENTTLTYKLTLDNTYPTINYSTGIEANDSYVNRNWIYVNVTANDTNEKNITFRLYNTSGPVNITTYTTPVREINFTNLYPDMQYWYNVTIIDEVGFSNSTVTYKITLDSTYPWINLSAPDNDTFINYELVEFNYTPIDTSLDACILYGNFTGAGFGPNETENNPVNGSINTFGPLNLSDGRYIWNVWCNDSAANSNFSQYNYTVKVDTQSPVISNWNTNGTTFSINEYICLNVSVTDSFAGVHTVYAELEDPNTDVENVSLLDDGSGCDAVGGDNVYSKSYYLEFGGNYTWLNTHANDSAGNWQHNVTNLKWNVTAVGSMTVVMVYPSSDIEINESEYNYEYQQTCNVSCDAGGINCENVTLFAEYNPDVFKYINTTTTDLINDEDNFSCGDLTAGGAPCSHTFNITSGSDSGNNTWLIRCSVVSDNVGAFVSSEVNLTINDHPYANFTYPTNNTWLVGVEMLNASASFDSDGSITNYLFEYDNNTAFSSSSTICNGADVNCTWNTSQQDQCENNSMSCYLRVTVTDDDGLTNSTYIVIGFDTLGPTVILCLPRNFENISSDLFTVNATPTDNESGVDTVIFEYRQNNSDTWHFACDDNRSPIYDCEWNLTNLTDGNTYEFRAYANDSKGNIGNYDNHTNITIDRTGPVIYLENPIDGANVTNNTVIFYYNASDATSTLANCSLVIDGSIVNTTDNPAENITLNFTYNLSDGSYNWSVNCTDLLGNKNSSEIREINIDTAGPVSVLDRPPNSSFVTGSSYTVNASVSDSGLADVDSAIFEYRQNSTASWNLICIDNRSPIYDCEWDTTVLPDGDEYEVRVYANDTWGNVGGFDVHVNITIDNNNPSLTLVSPEDDYIDTDGDLVFVYQVTDISPIANCILIINDELNQTNNSVQRGINQYFYLYGREDGTQLNWSINCTDQVGLINASETRNITVSISADMNLNLTMNKSSYFAGETAVITNNVTDTGNNPISDVDVSTAVVFANTTVPWWNGSWQRRKPITLSSASDLTNAIVEVNITGLDNNISDCENEIRIVRFDSSNVLTSVNRTIVSGDDSTYCVAWFRANMSAGVNNTEYMAYYNNSGASDPNNNETRRTTNTTKTALGGSIFGPLYDTTDGSYSDTTSDNSAYYAVGRDNSPPTGQQLNAYINLSYNLSDLGASESDLVSLNFTINYCHSDDIAAPITCGGAIGAGSAGTAYVELYDFDASGWDPGFDTITQDINDAGENTDTYIETDTLDDYVDNTTSILWVRYETDIGGLDKWDDASFALDYAILNVYYKQEVYTGLESIGETQLVIASNSSQTDFQGLWIWNWDTSGQQAGNYSAVSLASKTGYNNNYDYYWFEIEIDNTGPVSVLDRPQNDSIINALLDGYIYTVNASVTDAGIGKIDTVTFLYRYNSTDTWKIICNDSDGSAPFECDWNLTGLSNGNDYEVRVYANDTAGNVGDNDTHVNISIITEPVNIIFIIVDDDVTLPLDQIDLNAGSTKTVYCNITVNHPDDYTSIEGVNATFYSTTTTYDAADNNRTHYTNSSCLFLTGGGQSADYQCIFNVWHYAINGSWNCTAFTWDNYSTDNATDNTTMNQLFALNISTSVIDYTDLQPNQTSPNVTVNISNVGNMPMNISVYGFGGEDEILGDGLSMICQINNISVGFERFSTSSTDDYGSKTALSSTEQDLGLTIDPKTSPGDIRINSTYWQFMVPPEEHAFGECNGSVVFVAESP